MPFLTDIGGTDNLLWILSYRWDVWMWKENDRNNYFDSSIKHIKWCFIHILIFFVLLRCFSGDWLIYVWKNFQTWRAHLLSSTCTYSWIMFFFYLSKWLRNEISFDWIKSDIKLLDLVFYFESLWRIMSWSLFGGLIAFVCFRTLTVNKIRELPTNLCQNLKELVEL